MGKYNYAVYAWSKASMFDADPIDFPTKQEAIDQATRDVTFVGPPRRNQLRADGAIVERLGGVRDELVFAIWRDDKDVVQRSTVASVIRAVELMSREHQSHAAKREEARHKRRHGSSFPSPRAECRAVMEQIADSLAQRMGEDKVTQTLTTTGARPGDKLSPVKQFQNMLVHTTADLATAVRHGAGSAMVVPRTWGEPTPSDPSYRMTMSKQAAQWWYDQTDAVQFTLAREVMMDMAKKRHLHLDRASTVY